MVQTVTKSGFKLKGGTISDVTERLEQLCNKYGGNMTVAECSWLLRYENADERERQAMLTALEAEQLRRAGNHETVHKNSRY